MHSHLLMVFVPSYMALVSFSGAGPPFSQLYLRDPAQTLIPMLQQLGLPCCGVRAADADAACSSTGCFANNDLAKCQNDLKKRKGVVRRNEGPHLMPKSWSGPPRKGAISKDMSCCSDRSTAANQDNHLHTSHVSLKGRIVREVMCCCSWFTWVVTGCKEGRHKGV